MRTTEIHHHSTLWHTLTRQTWVLAAVGMALLAGCGGTTDVPDPNGESEKQSLITDDSAGKQLRIAVIPKGLSHQFWLTIKAGAEAAAKEGGAKILWQGPAKETEVEKQINIVQDMINSKVDALVLAACDQQALIPMVKKARDAGIPVITIDSGIASNLALSFVATDNVAGAKMAANTLAELIGKSGKVGLIPFIKGAATSNMREEGFLEGIAAFPDIEVSATLYCQSDVAKAMEVTQDMLTRDADLKGIFATNEPAAIGAAQAIKSAGKQDQVMVVAFDAAEEEITALKSGALKALIVQNPYRMGYLGVEAALRSIAGMTIEKRIDTGVTVVTMDNFNDAKIQKLLYPLEQKRD
ncbi:MAG: ABC transporter substrate-binding protein [Candidatus Hydrogenedentes bacterium]|nr:ABC transporter substrate-binding protein [Candidatus Hydrogenedentota bacterium]